MSKWVKGILYYWKQYFCRFCQKLLLVTTKGLCAFIDFKRCQVLNLRFFATVLIFIYTHPVYKLELFYIKCTTIRTLGIFTCFASFKKLSIPIICSEITFKIYNMTVLYKVVITSLGISVFMPTHLIKWSHYHCWQLNFFNVHVLLRRKQIERRLKLTFYV